jgi:predicted phage terminase large subunit-like protein
VGTTWLHADEKHFLIDLVRNQCDYPTLSRLVLEQNGKHKPDALLIEDHGSGSALIQDLRQRHGIRAIPITPTKDKIVRLSIVSPMFERGEIFLPQNADWLMDFLDELLKPDLMTKSTASRNTLIGIAPGKRDLRCFGHDAHPELASGMRSANNECPTGKALMEGASLMAAGHLRWRPWFRQTAR